MNSVAEKMNLYGKECKPFFFMFDFELKKPVIYQLNNLPQDIIISTELFDNSDPERKEYEKIIRLRAEPVSFAEYSKAFNNVIKNIEQGNTYLLNLTFPSKISTKSSLQEVYYCSKAKYRLLFSDSFVVFSPEIFVKIEQNGTIRSFPMKGTIDSSLPDAEREILTNEKEISEHNTIVDLIRNDISMNADNVRLVRYRYIDKIDTPDGNLLQVSSEIAGSLGHDWKTRVGDIITSMLPAGSISGAPKNETLRIIKESEIDERGYYTGVFGIFNGQKLDSAVMIRFIEQNDTGYVYRSGGGITFMSDAVMEYEELIKKIYVPVG